MDGQPWMDASDELSGSEPTSQALTGDARVGTMSRITISVVERAFRDSIGMCSPATYLATGLFMMNKISNPDLK